MAHNPNDLKSIRKEAYKPEDIKQRMCLRCFGLFRSLWAGNRICNHCKKSTEWAHNSEDTTYEVSDDS